jgi:spore germination protein KB
LKLLKVGDKVEETNDRISGFQLSAITFFLTGAMFVGLGIVSMYSLAGRDVWISIIMSFIVCIIPLLLLIYYVCYKPDKNIFEKNRILFGKWIGTIVNIIISGYVLFMLLLIIWSTTGLAITMYLVKTPTYFIAGIFVLTAIYAATKGIETIARTSEVLFFMGLAIYIINTISLTAQMNIDYLKPVLINGITPAIRHSLHFTSYLFTPLILITVIPKKSIVQNKHYKRYLAAGVFGGIVLMMLVFTLTEGVITPEIATFYRYPAYYIQRHINIGGALNNLENFLSLHWFLNTFILIAMAIYFLSKFFEDLFKIKTKNIKHITTLVIGMIAVYLSLNLFKNTVVAVEFMKYSFPVLVSLILFLLMVIVNIVVFIKKHKKKTSSA